MSFDYKKLLPVSLRSGLWGEFIQAFQSQTSIVKTENIKTILNQYDIELASDEQVENLIAKLGWKLFKADGWCSTREYLNRELLTIASRILYKTTPKSYEDENYIFNLYGKVFPMVRRFEDDSLTPFTEFETSSEQAIALDILDSDGDNILYYISSGDPVFDTTSGSTLPAGYLDTPTILASLDQFSFVDSVTRSILFSYEFNVIEDSTQFMSRNSLLALKSDTKQIKKATEKIYFEPTLTIPIGQSGDLKFTTFNNYDGTLSFVQRTLTQKQKDLFGYLQKIELGSGSLVLYSGMPYITGIQNPILTIDSFDDLTYSHSLSPETWIYRKRIVENQVLPDFTEMAAFDNSGSCVVYSSFPKIVLNSGSCYSNIQFKFTYS